MRIIEMAQAVSQGPRDEMQDVVTAAPYTHGSRYMGVFDGHGDYGEVIAEQASTVLLETAAFQDDIFPANRGAANVGAALRTLHLSLRGDHKARDSGSTATVAVFKDTLLSLVQLGDSGAMYLPNEGESSILTRPHDGSNDDEIERVANLDPPVRVLQVGRVLRFGGNMMISRAIGDHNERYISGTPEYRDIIIEKSGVLLIGTDGTLGSGTDSYKQTAEYAKACLRQDAGLQETAEELTRVFSDHHFDNAGVILARIG